MRKKGESSRCPGKSCASAPINIMISRIGVESQTARYTGHGAMTCPTRSSER